MTLTRICYKNMGLSLLTMVILVSYVNRASANELTQTLPYTLSLIISSTVLQASLLQRIDKNLHEVDHICHKISNKLGSVKLRDCLGRGMKVTGGHSVNGLPVIVKEYGPKGENRPLARVLLIGGIHGDEYSSVSLVFKWMKILDQYHSGMFHWRMVPLMNPDGLLQKKSQRMNKNGVDLNRNFPTPNWKKKSHAYWVKTSRNPRRYPGSEPLSEPESQWLAKYIADFKPNVIVSIHAPFGILDFDGPRKAPNRLGSLQLNLLGTYPGSLGNYAGINKQIPVVTIELPYAGIMPSKTEIKQIWRDLVKWLKNNANEHLPSNSQNITSKMSVPTLLGKSS